jgi:acyl carrier protein
MTALDRLKEAFISGLGLPPGTDVTALEYREIPEWDSIAHLTLVIAIETEFDIMFETSDVLGMSSFAAAVETIKRHGVDVSD